MPLALEMTLSMDFSGVRGGAIRAFVLRRMGMGGLAGMWVMTWTDF